MDNAYTKGRCFQELDGNGNWELPCPVVITEGQKSLGFGKTGALCRTSP
jgi:hypothetical protein